MEMKKKKIDIDDAYSSISYAETYGEKNPFIRTRVQPEGGSTAFGPAQITAKLAEGSAKNGYLKKSKEFYEKEMKPRYKKMLHNGGNKGKVKDYNERYDYGGDAEFDADKNGKDYETFAKEIMTGVAGEAKEDENVFVQKYRGKSEKEDPEYYKRYREGKQKYQENKSNEDIGKEVVRQLKATKK